MVSLATALTHCNARYVDDLVYARGASAWMNRAELEAEGPVQPMRPTDESTFLLFRQRMKEGLWPNLKVVHDPVEGFVVEAGGHINDWSIVAEYIGEVGLLKTHMYDSSDCLMDLLITGNDETSLTVNASRMGGIARFLSGINNKVKVRSVHRGP
eukprot:scaffold7243_cov394-Prasinococcus_capsulatus_cf.AAC.20